ncbi:hypothetical protein OF83DRAFT_1125717 [Amylostereum chailletii]|nr:hypothetical protein OF83DRAFT_1125717 [Amylostereum chailletii]
MPHNMDFRGRAYPLPPHLNHIGDDLSRGLLLFSEGKPLGERGLRWLKIHLANLYGYDKATFDERVDFVDQRVADIYDSAENPLNGRGWWKKADDPWQCLSTCMQLKAALDSPNPLEYVCPLPIHQDGTCNGLQHYAALGGDAVGAKQVNLDVGDRPSDVYTYVANMVEKRIAEDLEKGDRYAQMLNGKISRKVVKQTVMTTVYGVTFIGAREQIEKQLKDRGDVPYEECYLAAAYIAKKVLQCIGDLFKGANEIMTWLTTSARLIARSVPAERLNEALKVEKPRGAWKTTKNRKTSNRVKKEQMTAVVWTTPLGLPIVQPYRKVQRKQIMTSVQSVYITDPNIPAEVNSQKQASAFPPNFIHSLDATHMLLTALECRTQGLHFASVHDSYWTHPCDIDQMSGIIRETFIALHSSDILSRLESEFRERYKDHKVPLVSLRSFQIFRQLQANNEATAAIALSTASTADSSSETAPVDEGETVMTKQELAKLLDRGLGPRKKTADPADEVDEDAETEEDSQLVGKFVNLVDILPELPKKGEFDVNKIKSSAYFFSCPK